MWYSQLGCAEPCPGGGTLIDGQCFYGSSNPPPQQHNTPPQNQRPDTPGNNLPAPTLSVTGATVDEDDGTARFTVQLSRAISSSVTVRAATSDGTATGGNDYTSVDHVVTFPAYSTTAYVSVTIINDTHVEPDETFSLQLHSPSANAQLDTTEADSTIIDDDAPTHPSAPQNLALGCAASGGTFILTATWDPPTPPPS